MPIKTNLNVIYIFNGIWLFIFNSFVSPFNLYDNLKSNWRTSDSQFAHFVSIRLAKKSQKNKSLICITVKHITRSKERKRES